MKVLSPLLFCFCFTTALAQSSGQAIIATQGGLSEGKTLSISWTIGDLVTETAEVADVTTTQGFQQPTLTVREIETVFDRPVDMDSPKPFNSSLSTRSVKPYEATVYPNPVGHAVTFKIENAPGEYYLDLFDPAGNLILRNRSNNPQEVINLQELPAAQYVLRISFVDSPDSKAFQIIKSH